MPILRNYSSIAQPTTLSGSISAGATSINVGATTGFPTSAPYTLALDYGAATEELVTVTAVAGTTLTVTRGVDGTSAQSHSLGANVRHVASARDFADYQAHQAATTAVHGVAGTLVGTSDTQTLANKTLISPTINAGALSGTFTGAATWTGLQSLNGGVSSTGNIGTSAQFTGTGSIAAQDVFRGLVSGDAQNRFTVDADGRLEWGDGTVGRDTALYREAASILTTDDTVRVYRPTTGSNAFQARVSGDTVSRLNVNADGFMNWGPGGAAATDTNLYRNGAGVLKTDGALVAAGNLTAANFTPAAWVSYTPTWTAATTGPAVGNGTLLGYYSLTGKTCNAHIDLVWGSTTTGGSGNWSFALPFPAVAGHGSRVGTAQALVASRYAGVCVISAGASTTSPFFPDAAGGTALFFGQSAPAPTPDTWGNGHQLRISFTYEIA